MHDGQNLFDPALAFGGNEWKVDETLDAAAEDGSIEELIVIGVENTAERIYEYTPTTDPTTPGGGGGDLYLSLLVDELKPADRRHAAHACPIARTPACSARRSAGSSAPTRASSAPTSSASSAPCRRRRGGIGDVIIGDVAAMPAGARPARVYVDSGDSGDSNDDVTNTEHARGHLREPRLRQRC